MSKSKTTTPEVKTTTPVVKKEKPMIDLAALRLAKDITVKICKTCTIFSKGSYKAALKGRLLELTNPTKDLSSDVVIFTPAEIAKCHLGSMKGKIPKVNDTANLEKILTKYFSKAKIEVVKTAKKAEKKVVPATTPAANDQIPVVPANEKIA